MSTLAQYWDTWQTARWWAEQQHKPVLEVIRECVQKQIEYEQAPHCSNCGSRHVYLDGGEYSTGVVAPDGGREMVCGQWLVCCRCGFRSEDL